MESGANMNSIFVPDYGAAAATNGCTGYTSIGWCRTRLLLTQQARRLAGASCATVQGLQTLKASKILINNGYQLLDRRNKMQHYNIDLRLPIS
jgi:hypothetical protein